MNREAKPSGWGLPEERYPQERLHRFLDLLEARGMGRREPQEVPKMPTAPSSELLEEDVEALKIITDLTMEEDERISHSIGKSYRDLLGVRLGLPVEATDAVALPRNVDEVRRIVEFASARGIAIVPFGGGTSVLGGLRPLRGIHRAVLTVDLRRLNKVLEIDDTSMLARVEAGILGPELEEKLQSRGMTLGHYPQSFHFSVLGGWIATRSCGHLSGRYGGIEDMVQAVKVITPAGELATKGIPARSVGPELRELILGSEGSLGIIVEAVLRVRRKAEAKDTRVVLFDSFSGALDVCRKMVQAGIKPALVRISDEEESAMIMALAGLEAEDTPSLILLGFEGSRLEVVSGMEGALNILADAGGVDMGHEAASVWEQEYYRTPYLRDELLDRGYLVETLETAASWSRLWDLYAGVHRALQRVNEEQVVEGLILCHLSHIYRDGGSLYFTMIVSQLPGREVEQWQKLKEAATEVIMHEGGTLSHHHGIGVDHLQWMRAEHGEAALKALRAVKSALDPSGIMNPGKVLEEED
ncbi:MAG: FAD-binding oxidoreductase [Thermoplasmata archaeon]